VRDFGEKIVFLLEKLDSAMAGKNIEKMRAIIIRAFQEISS